MVISVDNLSYSNIQDRVKWLDKNIGPRLYYLHNQSGGQGWRYYSTQRTIEIEDEQWATMYILKFGV